MRSVAWLSLLAATACGRVGFGPTGDDGIPACGMDAHDEDGDTVTDGCDVCPHLPDPLQLDGDGDEVGDECDPEPEVPRQRLVVFDPFITADPSWDLNGNAMIGNDELRIGGVGVTGGASRSLDPKRDLFAVGATTGLAGTGQHFLALLTGPTVPPGGVYCEIHDDGAKTTLFLTYTYDGVTFVHPVAISTATLAGSSGRFAYELSPGRAACETSWGGSTGSLSSVRPTDIPIERSAIYAENVEARIHYFVQITTDE